MTAFLSFTIVNGSNAIGDDPYAASTASLGQTDTILGGDGTGTGSSDDSYYSSLTIPTGEFEVSSWREGVIERHQMSSIDSYEYLGLTSIYLLTDWYNGNVFEDFSFTRETETIREHSISTSISLGFEWSAAISLKVGIDGLEAGVETGPTVKLSIGSTTTYTYTQTEKVTVNVKVKQEYIDGKTFAVCSAAYVYKVKCQRWQYDNYWWGNYEVSNSRSDYYTYIAMKPTITLVYRNGEVVK